MFQLIPTKTKFFDLFDRSAGLLVETASQFHDLLAHPEAMKAHAEAIRHLEHRADDVTHEAIKLLHASFITPIERNDIRRLINRLDDIIDDIDDAAVRLMVYDVRSVFPPAVALAGTLVETTRAVQAAVGELRRLRKRNQILDRCIEIKRLENEGDRRYDEALGELFRSGLDPLTVIKWKDVIEDLESGLDSCERVANLLEGIELENG